MAIDATPTEENRSVIERTEQIGKLTGATVHVLHVARGHIVPEDITGGAGLGVWSAEDDVEGFDRRAVQQLVDKLSAAGVDAHGEITSATEHDLPQVILQRAEELDVDPEQSIRHIRTFLVHQFRVRRGRAYGGGSSQSRRRGGTTTLKVYSAFLAEADRRAAGSLATRMPELPGGARDRWRIPRPSHATIRSGRRGGRLYRRIAAGLRGAITSRVLRPGDLLPAISDSSERYKVSRGTRPTGRRHAGCRESRDRQPWSPRRRVRVAATSGVIMCKVRPSTQHRHEGKRRMDAAGWGL